eukprot:scaffold16800_cov129-Cylindrotheca_fusiformis.AAC.4
MSSVTHHAVNSPIVARASIVVRDSHLLGGSYRQVPAKNAVIGSHTSDSFLSPGEVILSSCIPDCKSGGANCATLSPMRRRCSASAESAESSDSSDDECQKQDFQRKGRFLVWPASFGPDTAVASSP